MDSAPECKQASIGILTALPEEYAAVKAMMNKTKSYSTGARSPRTYCIGQIHALNGGTHIVVLFLAGMGNNIAASKTTMLLEDFPNINSIIMVGIAGGAPNPEKTTEHVRLGDIVVSGQNGVIQYDFVKEETENIIVRPLPRPPSSHLLASVRRMEALEIEGDRPWLKFIKQGMKKLKIERPSEKTDILVSSNNPEIFINHPEDPKRIAGQPRVFIGSVASGNTLLKNARKRDQLRDQFGVRAFEMEGSGTAEATWDQQVGYLIVRGICDYSDDRKNDDWHSYAALVASAYTRALLEQTPVIHPKITFLKILQTCKEQVINQMQDLKGSAIDRSKKYIPNLYVKRAEIEKEFDEFLDQQEKNACVVVGEAGIGKTNLLCHLSEKLMDSRPVLFLNSMYINGSLEQHLIDALNAQDYPNLDQLMPNLNEALNEKNFDLIVFLDAINESPNPQAIKRDLADIVQNNIGNRIKFYISCRDMDWEFFLKDNEGFLDRLYSKKGRVFMKNDLRFNEFNAKEFKEAWTLYKRLYQLKGTLVKELRAICLHPLMLRFLAEGFEGQNLPSDVRRIEIFDQYWLRKLEHTGKESKATEQMYKFVAELKKKQKSELPKTEIIALLGDTTADLETVLSKILSENLITYLNWEGDRVVGFAYEAFFEYVMARWIIYGSDYQWQKKEQAEIINDLNNFIDEAKKFRIMRGTIQYLVMMMEGKKQDIHISMINEILKSQEPTWETFVINLSRKLKRPETSIGIIGNLAIKGNFKVFAIKTLGELGDNRVTEYLIKALDDEDSDVWNEAINSLSEVGSNEAVEGLINALKDKQDLSLRYAIVRALSKIKNENITKKLLKMADNADAYTKKSVIEILGKKCTEESLEFLLTALQDTDEMVVTSATESIGNILFTSENLQKNWNDKVTISLIELLKSPNKWIRISASEALGITQNRAAIKPLLGLLSDDDKQVRSRAIEALGRIGGNDILTPLIGLLNETDTIVAKNAIIALGMIGSNKAIPALVDLLCNKKTENRRHIFDAFQALGVEAALPLLVQVLREGTSTHMNCIIEAIGELRIDSGIEPLVEFMKSNEGRYEKEIMLAIEMIGGGEAENILLQISREQEKNPDLRLLAIDGLGRMRTKSAVDLLTSFVKTSDEKTRIHSIIALGKIGDQNSVETLIVPMKSGQPKIRQAVADALGEIGGNQVMKPLISFLTDSDPQVRISAIDSIGKLKSGVGVTPLLNLLSTESDYNAKISIVRALGEIGNAKSITSLMQIFEDKRQVAKGLNWMNQPTFGNPTELWKETVITLGKIASRSATDRLIRLYEDFIPPKEEEWFEALDYRLEIIESLDIIGDSAAILLLTNIIKSPLPKFSKYRADSHNNYESRVRMAAKIALINIANKENPT
ncbi:MAG: HEAT repeat domain-containing protein [Candidatus Bathyarchaeia archaeon]